jgi:hypothetical protein
MSLDRNDGSFPVGAEIEQLHSLPIGHAVEERAGNDFKAKSKLRVNQPASGASQTRGTDEAEAPQLILQFPLPRRDDVKITRVDRPL